MAVLWSQKGGSGKSTRSQTTSLQLVRRIHSQFDSQAVSSTALASDVRQVITHRTSSPPQQTLLLVQQSKTPISSTIEGSQSDSPFIIICQRIAVVATIQDLAVSFDRHEQRDSSGVRHGDNFGTRGVIRHVVRSNPSRGAMQYAHAGQTDWLRGQC